MAKKAWMVETWFEDNGKWVILGRRFYNSDEALETARKEGRLTPTTEEYLIEVYEMKESFRQTIPYVEPIVVEAVDIESVEAKA